MSLSNDLSGVLARDSRYAMDAYLFIFEAIDYTRRLREPEIEAAERQGLPISHHVTGQQLSDGAARLAALQYGLLAEKIVGDWGIHATSDVGNIVYLLIDSGDLEKTPSDSRDDFENVFDWAKGLRERIDFAFEDVA